MSLVRQGSKILGLDQNGMLYLINATPEKLIILDSKKISNQETWAHLAVSGGQVAIRQLKAIALYDWKASVIVP